MKRILVVSVFCLLVVMSVSHATASEWWSGWMQVGGSTASYEGSADINGDNKDDLLVYDGRLYLNRSEGTSVDDWVHGWEAFAGATATSYEGIADVNGDGTDDVLVWDGRLWIHISGYGWSRVGGSTAQLAGVVDVNGDGKDDLIVYDSFSGGYLTSYLNVAENTISGGDWENGWTQIGGFNHGLGRWTAVYLDAVDVNGDGKDDLVVDDGNVYVNYSEGTSADHWDSGWSQVGSPTATYGGSADVNGDGKDDLIVNDGRVHLNYSEGTLTDDWVNGWTTLGGATATSYEGKADVNGDSIDDVLVWDGRLWMYVSNYGWSRVGSITAQLAGVVDVNGDGKDDLIVYDNFSGGYLTSHLHVADGTIGGGDWENTWTQIGGYNHGLGRWTAVYLDAVDVNGDGKDDLIVDDGLVYLRVSGVDVDGDGYTPAQGDCNDNNANIHPGATEVCDGVDNDCDGTVDEGLTFDVDGDGHSTPGSCGGTKDDCDDTDATVYPGAPELCDGIDNDCDGIIPANEADADNDGYMVCEGDCDDNDVTINPGVAELADCIDNDCDGAVDENDSTVPSGKISVSPNIIWPPNHEMVNITVDASGITDANLDTVAITDITSSEPDNDLGDGDTTGDKIITGDLTGAVRAERSGIKGTGVGRTYTVTVTAIDCAGNETDFTATVVVPHDKRK